MGEERSTMEETLLAKVQIDSKTENDEEEEEEQRNKRSINWDIYIKELKRICHISGELYLSSAALSISFTGVTGFSFL
ncbi:hypothetical protein L195_g037894, partial [Trifolium pratense]